jgi:hypothetical protein
MGRGLLNMSLRNIIANQLGVTADFGSEPDVHSLHPSNTYLFPQLDGVWQHYQRFYFTSVSVKAVPTASAFQTGNLAITIVPPN